MLPISICIIAKNEEKHIDNCLSAIQKYMGNYPHEIVFIDTGSTDQTVELAKKYTDKIFFFEWIGDFSAARNYSISCASNDWILVLDCDEYIEAINLDILDLMTSKYPTRIGVITQRSHCIMNQMDSIYSILVSRFFNRKYYHYESIIHEQVRPLDPNLKVEHNDISLSVEHFGYTGSKEELLSKANRNIKLLLQALDKSPDNPYLYFQLGQAYNSIQDTQHACYYYGKGLDYATNPSLGFVQTMVIGYGYALLDLKKYEDALLLENLYDDFCQTADFVCMMGIIYLRNGMVAEALREFTNATTIKTCHVEGANSFIPTFNIGCINEVLGNRDVALSLYEKCGNFAPALERLRILQSAR